MLHENHLACACPRAVSDASHHLWWFISLENQRGTTCLRSTHRKPALEPKSPNSMLSAISKHGSILHIQWRNYSSVSTCCAPACHKHTRNQIQDSVLGSTSSQVAAQPSSRAPWLIGRERGESIQQRHHGESSNFSSLFPSSWIH